MTDQTHPDVLLDETKGDLGEQLIAELINLRARR